MSRKHYEAVARVIRSNKVLNAADPHAAEVIDDVAKDLAQAFYTDNDRFNRDRFLAACEVSS